MRIKGTSKADVLRGTAFSDVVEGGRGNDWLEGGAGDDLLVGGGGADTFVLRSGHGHDTVSDFDPNVGDRVLFDFGSWSDLLYMGRLSDGLEFSNFTGTANFVVTGGDFNADGVTDTRISANEDSITLLGWAPDQLMGWSLVGG
jgi:Ca2+-binding RTX toxin-like protein